MAIKFIFEDGENTPSSLLLKKSYYGDFIYFSNGVSRLLDKAMEVRDDGDSVFLFYDMSPNNFKTVKGYEALLDTIRQDKLLYQDVFVIPILCIEYHICRAFEDYNWFYVNGVKEKEMIEKLVINFDWAHMSEGIKKDSYIGASLEHAYKYIIANLKLKCMHNSFEYVGGTGVRKSQSISGIFYERDCTCERKYCPIDCTDVIEIKAEKVYCSLPGFAVITDEHRQLLDSIGIRTLSMSTKDVKMQRRLFYKRICDNMGLPLPSIDI